MSISLRLFLAASLLASFAACSDSTTATDGGGTDGGGTAPDGSMMHSDGGGTGTDGGGTDLGPTDVDLGGTDVDLGGTDVDLGGTGTDAGTGADAGMMMTGCDDGIDCTLDGTSASGACTHVPSDMLCDAMPGGTCSRTTGCTYPTPCTMPSDCDDGNPCTRDICGMTSMVCFHMAAGGGTTCDDGLDCTTGDRCVGTVCEGRVPAMCDDMNPCTADSCDATGACTHPAAPDGSMCLDGNRCTGGESCMAGVCTPTTMVMCMDAADVCCPGTGRCAATCP